MAFKPDDIAVSDATGEYPSLTQITLEGDTIRMITDGDPFPAAAGNPLINDGITPRRNFLGNNNISDQSRDLTFTYRATRNSENSTDRRTGPVGVVANGVYLNSPSYPINKLPDSVAEPHPGLNYDISKLANIFKLDDASGSPDADGNYGYYNGDFIGQVFKDAKVYQTNEYYNNTAFGKDHMRHPDGHSKIIGFCFDGYPVYGPFAYGDPKDTTSRIGHMRSSYRLKENDRHRPEGFKATDVVDVGDELITLEMGTFIQDYEFVENLGSLDQYNGRFCITPDYPQGTYAYFVTYEDQSLETPAYPYIFGNQTKQFRTAGLGEARYVESLWNLGSGNILSTLVERNTRELRLPIANGIAPRLEIIAGALPGGLRIEGLSIKGTPFEVERDTVSKFVIRAYFNGRIEDRTFEIITTGPDEPYWITNEGLLDAGPSNHYFVLDNELIDYQLLADDNDLPAGDELTYFIAEGDGNLPPGLKLTLDGKIQGIVEPLFALAKNNKNAGYDGELYDSMMSDYNVKSANGYATYFYDLENYDFNVPTLIPKKLNRYYPFIVTVTDGDTFVKREFNIYLVGDDYLRADNAIMQSGTGIFTADNTYLRNPVWLTPRNLGFRRANNYVTLFLDVIENEYLYGQVYYTLDDFNDDGSPSELPPGMSLDTKSGEVVGRVPYQPAITENYKFSVTATRFEGDTGTATIFGTYYEDTLLGTNQFKIGKLNLSGDIDGVDDLRELVTRTIKLYNREYRVTAVDDTNPDYDVITLDQTLNPFISLSLTRQGKATDSHIFVQELTGEQQDRILNRNLKFSDSESYVIDSIIPYLEYTVRDRNFGSVYASDLALDMTVGTEFNLGDYAKYEGDNTYSAGIYQLAFGDKTTTSVRVQQFIAGNIISPLHGLRAEDYDGAPVQVETTGDFPSGTNGNTIYFLRVFDVNTLMLHTTKSGALNPNTNTDKIFVSGGNGFIDIVTLGQTFTTKAQTDNLGVPLTDEEGQFLLEFDNLRWQYIGPSQLLLSQSINNDMIVQSLTRKYPQGEITFVEKATGAFELRMASTAYTRLISKVAEFFYGTETNATLLSIARDNENRINLQTPLQRNITDGRNIGIALFRGDFFSKDVAVAEEDELVDFPSKSKTFEINIIGEIDTTIKWITQEDLGVLPANFLSTLKVEATTTVPDTSLIYTLVDGRLPFGLRLDRSGELIGRPRQFANRDGLGLTTFDGNATTYDGISGEKSSFDREFKFTVEARDRFGLSAITKEFKVSVSDEDNLRYSNLFIRPLLAQTQRNLYQTFVSNPDVFPPEKIYRPNDPEFGIQKQIQMLAYAGIETKNANVFVAATGQHHKKRKLRLGEFKTAVAKQPGSNEIIYEVVYIDVIDPQKPKTGNTKKSFSINNKKRLTVDSIEYSVLDDNTNLGSGISEFPVYGRQIARIIVPSRDEIIIDPREGSNILIDADNEDFTVTIRPDTEVTVVLLKADSEPMRFRPDNTTIKADNTSVNVAQVSDNMRYNSNIDHMRDQIELTGNNDRLYLPLWMRTPQEGTELRELDYTTAVPVCYCKPGTSADILLRIQNLIDQGNFDVKSIDFTIDRYVIDRTTEDPNEQYILFPNYQYNV